MPQPDGPADITTLNAGLAALDPLFSFLILDREFKIRWISQRAIQELKLPREQLLGRSWYELFPESRSRHSLHEEIFRGECTGLDLPCIALTRGGGQRYYSLRLRPLLAPSGAIESILALGEDVSARVSAEQALRANEERFRALSTLSNDIVVISTADGTVTFESESVERILGPRITPRAVISIYDNMHPDDLPVARDMFERLVANPSVGIGADIEIRKRHEDGRWRWLQFTGSNLLDLPVVGGIVLIGRDITARKIADLKNAETQQLLSSALWGTQAACWSADLEADTMEFTDNFFSMTGIDRNAWDADIEPWCTWVHADDAPMGCARYRAHLAGATEAYEHEYRIRTPGGWMWLKDRGKVVERDPAGRPRRIAGTTIDISAHKALEKGLIEALNREQRRLSRNLHEGVAQSLVGIALLIASISRKCQTDRPDIKEHLDDVLTELRAATDETRSLVRGFLPASIERGDVGTALRELAEELSAGGQMAIECDTSRWDFQPMPAEAAQHVYAAARQALLAALEESHATESLLRLTTEGDELCLVITHNGFAVPIAITGAADLNLTLMTYRAQALGGAAGLERVPDGKSRITLRCPIARPSDSTRTYQTIRGFCDCIALHERNVHLRQSSFPKRAAHHKKVI